MHPASYLGRGLFLALPLSLQPSVEPTEPAPNPPAATKGLVMLELDRPPSLRLFATHTLSSRKVLHGGRSCPTVQPERAFDEFEMDESRSHWQAGRSAVWSAVHYEAGRGTDAISECRDPIGRFLQHGAPCHDGWVHVGRHSGCNNRFASSRLRHLQNI